MPETGPLKLRAHDGKDLRMLAACLQDALVPVSDIAYLKTGRRFVMVANRFKWESGVPSALDSAPSPGPAARTAEPDREPDVEFEEAGGGALFERVNCAVTFDWVRSVRFRGLDLRRKGQIPNLLTLEAGPGTIALLFSGSAAIRLEVSDIRCHLEDLGEPWPTRWRPGHAGAEAVPPESG